MQKREERAVRRSCYADEHRFEETSKEDFKPFFFLQHVSSLSFVKNMSLSISLIVDIFFFFRARICDLFNATLREGQNKIVQHCSSYSS